MISIVVPNYNHSFLLPLLMKSYNRHPFKDDEVEMIIVDDCSEDPFLEMLRLSLKYVKPWFTVKAFETGQRTTNPCKPLNIAVKKSRGDIILINSMDVMPATDVLPAIHKAHKETSNLYLMPKLYIDMCCTEWQETCACVSMARKMYEELGGWDERYRYIGMEDLDFLWRVKESGYIMKRDPSMVYMHINAMFVPKIFNMKEHEEIFNDTHKVKKITKVNPDGWGELDTLEEVKIR